jgi:ribosomal-protein-alanine N-acetyltransferase
MITHKGTQTIQTERLLLRKILPEDARAVYAWMGDPAVCEYECWRPHPDAGYSRGYIAEVFDYSERLYWWGIELGGGLIGSVCAVNVDDLHQKATLGYCLARRFWSKGYATEAVQAVLDYMFAEVGLNRVEASHAVGNISSGRVLQKAGLLLEGRAKDYLFFNAGVQDSNLYGITKAQYLRAKEG